MLLSLYTFICSDFLKPSEFFLSLEELNQPCHCTSKLHIILTAVATATDDDVDAAAEKAYATTEESYVIADHPLFHIECSEDVLAAGVTIDIDVVVTNVANVEAIVGAKNVAEAVVAAAHASTTE